MRGSHLLKFDLYTAHDILMKTYDSHNHKHISIFESTFEHRRLTCEPILSVQRHRASRPFLKNIIMSLFEKVNDSVICQCTEIRSCPLMMSAVRREEGFQCGHFSNKEGSLQMRTTTLLGAKNMYFSKLMMCPHGQGWGRPGGSHFGHFSDRGKRSSQFFAIFCRHLLWTAVLIQFVLLFI